ncbi:hypothetical protein [Arthrobacter methylotrophus]|uniref:Uncharacterized protein n=2 Tax=Arthrobacter methylotrophus TaxID=121291 RepID=A0ABV5URJ2_9MICC
MASNDAVPTTEQLQDLLLESPGFTEFLLGPATISASMLDGREPLLCAITVELDEGPSTVASSTAAAQRLDEKQYALAVPIQTDSSSRAALNCPPSQMNLLALAMQELDTERMADS